MKVRIAPLGGGYLIYADDDDGRPMAADVNVIDISGLRSRPLIESALQRTGYLLVDRRSGYLMLLAQAAGDDSDAVRQARARMPPWLRAQTLRSLAADAGLGPAGVLDVHAHVKPREADAATQAEFEAEDEIEAGTAVAAVAQ
jgi:hypothetical protein